MRDNLRLLKLDYNKLYNILNTMIYGNHFILLFTLITMPYYILYGSTPFKLTLYPLTPDLRVSTPIDAARCVIGAYSHSPIMVTLFVQEIFYGNVSQI